MPGGLVIVIPAAGASLRMRGADKLSGDVDGLPALRHAAVTAVRSGVPVIVTLPDGGPHAAPRRAELPGLGVTALPIPDAHEGMAASLRAGVRAAGNAEAVLVMLPDMPEITVDDLAAMIAAHEAESNRALRGTAYDGTPGHPVVLPRRLFAEVAVLTGDEGARRVLSGEDVGLVRLPGRHAVLDLDTPEDWADWRAGRL